MGMGFDFSNAGPRAGTASGTALGGSIGDGAGLNSSNWTVATGGSKATGGTGIPTVYLIVGAIVLGLVLWKKR